MPSLYPERHKASQDTWNTGNGCLLPKIHTTISATSGTSLHPKDNDRCTHSLVRSTTALLAATCLVCTSIAQFLLTSSVAPEPGSIALLLSLIPAGAIFARKRRRRLQ